MQCVFYSFFLWASTCNYALRAKNHYHALIRTKGGKGERILIGRRRGGGGVGENIDREEGIQGKRAG